MKRRQLIIGLGGLAGLGGSVIGTGAFTSVSAERDVTVETAGDANAFLAMEPIDSPNGNAFATTQNGLVALEFTSTEYNGQELGKGLGTDSVYDFDDVFRITNQGTQPVYVWATFAGASGNFDVGSSDTDVWLYADGDSDNKLRDSDDDVLYLTPGADADIGVHIDTHDVDLDQKLTATINANANKPADDGGVVGGGATRISGPTDGLSGYWPLDDIGGRTATDVAGSNGGTVVGDVSIGAEDGRDAATFDAPNEYIQVGTGGRFGFSQFTVAAWAKVSDTDAGLRTVLARQDPTANNPHQKRTFVLWFDDADEFFGAEVITARAAESDGDLQDVTADDQAYTDGEWHHLVATAASDGALDLYVDGDSKGTQSVNGPLYTGPGQTWIGLSPGQDRPLDGAVDDVRIYDRVLSQVEVEDLYNATK